MPTHPSTDPIPDLERALDVTTQPRDLARLATHRLGAVREAVAQNPNTPLRQLERLAVAHTGAVLRNRVLDLLTLENPNWLSELPEPALLALLRHPSCPEAWLEWALAHGGNARAWLAVAQNPGCPERLLLAMCAHDTAPGEAAALHVSLEGHETARERLAPRSELNSAAATGETVLRGFARGLERDPEVTKDLLAAGVAPAWLLAALHDDDDLELRQQAARHPDLPEAALEPFLLNSDPETRLAARDRAGPEWQEFLRHIESPGASLGPEEAARLQRSEYGRLVLAAQPGTPSALLEPLAADEDWRVRQAAAQNPALSVSALARLAADLDKDVRLAVASHPRAAKATLARLMLDGSDEVRGAARTNPAAPEALRHTLERLEAGDPALSGGTLARLVRRDETTAELALTHVNATPEMLRAFAGNDAWKLRQAVARNANTPFEVLERLVSDSDHDVRAAITLNPGVSERLLNLFERDPHPLVRSGVALNPRSSAAALERLALDSDPEVRQAVCINPNTPAALLERLSRDEREAVRRAVALHPRTPAAVLEALSRDPEAEVRAAVADHPASGAECALGLFGAAFEWRDLYRRVRAGGDTTPRELHFLYGLNEFAQGLVLGHPQCPPALLEGLADSDDWRVRQRIAQHPRAPAALLARFAEDGDYDVREAVAHHPATPEAALARLVRDDYAQVRRALLGRERLAPELAEHLAWDEDDDVLALLKARGQAPLNLRERAERGEPLEPAALHGLEAIGTPLALRLLARNPAVDARTLGRLGSAEDWHVRLEVARGPNTPVDTLEALSSDSDVDVRRAVATNPVTPVTALRVLLHDTDASVRRAALAHPSLPETWRAAAGHALLTRGLTLGGLTRLLALSHPALPRSEFSKQRNLHAPEWLERLALARNPAAPVAALSVLSEDANRLVRREAELALTARAAVSQGTASRGTASRGTTPEESA